MTSHPTRLLIVDDIADNRHILSRFFRRRGFEAVEAENGVAALALLAEQSFDAILLDVVMPQMNGLDALKKIRETYTQSSLPVIMVTAKVESQDIVQALELGANDYISKPIDFSIAFARVQNQIARRQAERALADYVHKLENTNHQLEHEIAERKQSEARVRYLAHHDALTGLGNRVHFRDQLIRALGRVDTDGGTLALFFIDLDQFKLVNDTLGHRTGDLLLAAIGDRLGKAAQESEIVARIGGDEFAIIQMIKERPEEAGFLADKIMDAFGTPVDVEGHQLHVGCSIGIALAPVDGNDPDTLLSNADLALYRAEAEGRGHCCFFEADLNQRAQARRQLELELRAALVSRQFELFYQPIFDLHLKSGRWV